MTSETTLFTWFFATLAAVLFFALIPYVLFKTLRWEEKKLVTKEPNDGFLVATHFPNWLDLIVLMSLFALLAQSIPNPSLSTEESLKAIDSPLLISNLVIQTLGIGFVVLLLFWRTNLTEYFGLRPTKKQWLHFLWCPAIILTVWLATALIHGLGYFQFLEETYGKSPLQEAVLILQQSTDPVLLSLLVASACIGAPFSEEILFRGYLYPVLKGFAGRWVAVLFSSGLFAVIHFNLAAFPSLFLMGVLLALSYEYSKTIWVPITAHLLFNSATTIIQIASRYFPELAPQL